jgi:hypothetical protein
MERRSWESQFHQGHMGQVRVVDTCGAFPCSKQAFASSVEDRTFRLTLRRPPKSDGKDCLPVFHFSDRAVRLRESTVGQCPRWAGGTRLQRCLRCRRPTLVRSGATLGKTVYLRMLALDRAHAVASLRTLIPTNGVRPSASTTPQHSTIYQASTWVESQGKRVATHSANRPHMTQTGSDSYGQR